MTSKGADPNGKGALEGFADAAEEAYRATKTTIATAYDDGKSKYKKFSAETADDDDKVRHGHQMYGNQWAMIQKALLLHKCLPKVRERASAVEPIGLMNSTGGSVIK